MRKARYPQFVPVLAVFMLAAIIVSGCSKVTKTYVPDAVFVNTQASPYITENEEIDLSLLNYDDYTDLRKKKILIAEMVALSDRKCSWHKATIMANANVWNIGAGSAAMLFAGASADDKATYISDLTSQLRKSRLALLEASE